MYHIQPCFLAFANQITLKPVFKRTTEAQRIAPSGGDFCVFGLKIIGLVILAMLLPIVAQCEDEHENTTLIGRWAHSPYRSVAVQDDIAYFGCGAALRIFDYSDPENPEELGEVVFPRAVIGIEVEGDYAYLVSCHTCNVA